MGSQRIKFVGVFWRKTTMSNEQGEGCVGMKGMGENDAMKDPGLL